MSSRVAKSLVIRASGAARSLVQRELPLPQPRPNQVLVKVSRAAQNPTDVMAFDRKIFGEGHVLGCDFVGTVEELGANVTRFAKGDTIAGLIWGGEIKGLGAYSEYTLADERIAFEVPKNISLDQAATIPLASLTAFLAFFSEKCLNIDLKDSAHKSVLIWGGSSSVGLYAIQIAKIYGLEVVTTCSPRSFHLARYHGADHVFDYHDPEVVRNIKEAVPNLKYVFDTIGNSTSSVLGSQAIDEKGGTLCTVRPGKEFTEDVSKQTKVTSVLVWTSFLKDHKLGDNVFPADEDDHKLAYLFCEKLPGYIEEGSIKPNKPKVYGGGLGDVEAGFQEYRDGKISGYKVVYQL